MRTTDSIISSVTLHAEATVLAAGRGEASSLAVLVDGVDDPVDAGIIADGNVTGVDKDNLEVLVSGILVNPVRVQHTHVSAGSASTLLGNTAQVADELELVDTVVLGLTIHNTLVVGSLSATAANSDTVDDETLLGLVAELVGLVSSGGAVDLDDLLVLAILPSSINTMYPIITTISTNFLS